MGTPIRRDVSVSVEYDRQGQRVVKQFASAYAARRFYATKHRQGKRPRVLAGPL